MAKRVFVDVVASFHKGCLTPLRLTWPDGRVFRIDRVLDMHLAPAVSGGLGLRYRCRILGAVVPLYYDEEERVWWCDGADRVCV